MPSTRPERILAALGLVTALTLAALIVPAAIDYRSSAPAAAPTERAASTTSPRPAQPAPTTRRPVAEEPRPTTTPPPPAPTRTELELVATRGDCWLDVRLGSAQGRSVFVGILTQGSSRRFVGRTLWIEIGAPSALDATVNGTEVTNLADSPTTVLATPDGIRPAAA